LFDATKDELKNLQNELPSECLGELEIVKTLGSEEKEVLMKVKKRRY